MAAPRFHASGIGATDAGGAWQVSSNLAYTSASIGNVIVLQILQDGTTSGAVSLTSVSYAAALDGTDSTMSYIGEFAVGSPTAALQHLWIGRRTSSQTPIAYGSNSTSEDVYCRFYEFADVSTGTTLADVIENASAGATVNTVGTSATAADSSVTTLGPDRLAVNFVAVNDDNAIAQFSGQTGGTWIKVAEYAESSGTDGAIQLQWAYPSKYAAYPPNGPSAIYGEGGADEKYAQSFTTSAAESMAIAGFWLRRTGSPTDDVVVELQSDSGGSPSGTVLASDAVSASDISDSNYEVHTFSLPYSLANATTYWLVVSRSGSRDTSNYCSIFDTLYNFSGVGKVMDSGSWSASADWSFWVGFGSAAIDGGTASITDSDAWGVVGFALIGTTGGSTTVSSSFSANAVIKKTGQSGSFSANAVIKKNSGTKTFTADSSLVRTVSSSFSANAVLKKSPSITGTWPANAIAKWPAGWEEWPIYAFAVIKRTQTGSLTANAVVKKTASSSLAANAIVRKNSGTLTFTAASVSKRTQSGSLTAAATIKGTRSGSLLANARLAGIFTIDAEVAQPAVEGSFSAASIIKRTQTGSLSVASVAKRTQSGSLTAAAVIKRTQSSTLTAAAAMKRTMSSSLPANAVVRASRSGSITADAVIKRTSGTLTFTAAAVIKRTGSNSLTAASVMKRTQSGSLTAAAIIKRATPSSFTAAAVIRRPATSSLSADALIERSATGSFDADALINLVSRCIWTTPGDTVQIDRYATLTFLMPVAATGNMHFEIQIDTEAGFTDPITYLSSHLTGWEYWDGDSWEPIPQDGVPNTYCGNEARYTIQDPLANGTYYRRVRAGVI
jgi:hypothetical protein